MAEVPKPEELLRGLLAPIVSFEDTAYEVLVKKPAEMLGVTPLPKLPSPAKMLLEAAATGRMPTPEEVTKEVEKAVKKSPTATIQT